MYARICKYIFDLIYVHTHIIHIYDKSGNSWTNSPPTAVAICCLVIVIASVCFMWDLIASRPQVWWHPPGHHKLSYNSNPKQTNNQKRETIMKIGVSLTLSLSLSLFSCTYIYI